MRTKALLTSILLGTTALAGVASADPIVRDHRYQPTLTVQPAVNVQARFNGRLQFGQRPVIQSNVAYGYQLDRDGDSYMPYTYGNDPRVEGIARREWYTLQSCVKFERVNNVRINLDDKPLRSVELQATSGDIDIEEIGIQYRDGSHSVVRPSRDLNATHSPNLRLDLGPKGLEGINGIRVYGAGRATFRVLGA